MAADPFASLDDIVFVPDDGQNTDVISMAPAPGSLDAYSADTAPIQASDAYVEQGTSEAPTARTNPVDPVDVDASGTLTAYDALLVIDHINHGDPSLTQPGDTGTAGVFYTDVNGDGNVTKEDVDLVFQAINDGHVLRRQAPVSAAPATSNSAPATASSSEVAAAPTVAAPAAESEVVAQQALASDEILAEGELPEAIELPPPVLTSTDSDSDVITENEVLNLLARAAGATSSQDAIIAIVDRGGQILGVRVEDGVFANITDMATLVFAIDGAVAKARTAAFFASDQAPLTSRTDRKSVV